MGRETLDAGRICEFCTSSMRLLLWLVFPVMETLRVLAIVVWAGVLRIYIVISWVLLPGLISYQNLKPRPRPISLRVVKVINVCERRGLVP